MEVKPPGPKPALPGQKAPKPEPAEEATKRKFLEPRPRAIPADESEVDEEDEIPDDVNLSGGFRSWLSRRFSKSRRET